MKKLLIGVLAVTSMTTFARSTKVICGNGSNDSDSKLKSAVIRAEGELNSKLNSIPKVFRVSAPTIQVVNNERFRNQSIAICVTVESK
ncbi:MAG: hypothetical protein N4A33_08505 [Bacteriovoracaceae bacterium]|jgi:hypothetical protein|nr:hypothetical protein [Bacteriovoracaceae bacterium]